MPSCGLLLFLYPTTFLFELMGQSVNALLRASSFSTLIDICINRHERKKVVDNNVSIPSFGSLPFLWLPSGTLYNQNLQKNLCGQIPSFSIRMVLFILSDSDVNLPTLKSV